MTSLALTFRGFESAQPVPPSVVGWGRGQDFRPAQPSPPADPSPAPQSAATPITEFKPVPQKQLSKALTETEALRDATDQFYAALNEARELSEIMVAEDEISPIDEQTLNYAIQSLLPLVQRFKLPPPLMLPLQNAGIGAEWHTSAMNIELRFRKPYHVYVLVEDARGALPTYQGRDPNLVQATAALACLSARAVR
jgi:hypothetical protein